MVPPSETAFPKTTLGAAVAKGVRRTQVLVHVVMMKFADASDAAKARLRLEELSRLVPEIRSMDCQLDELRTEVSWDLLKLVVRA